MKSLIIILILSFTLQKNNLILNKTDMNFDISLVRNFLKIHNIEGVTVVLYQTSIRNQNGYIIDYYIKQKPGNYYIIYITSNSTKIKKRAIIHELYHLKQYHTGDLKIDRNGKVLYKGNIYNIDKIPIKDRPWEKDIPTIDLNKYTSI